MRLADRLRHRLEVGHALEMPIDLADLHLTSDNVLAPAAVLIAVTDSAEPAVILTRRASHLRKHPGQVAFPGGRIDSGDADAVAAALREAEEEIALPPSTVEIIGVSDRYRTFTGFDIAPVIGVVPPDIVLRPHEGEVEAVFEVPLDYLFSPSNRVRREVEFQGEIRQYYEIIWEGHRIWGVTAAIVANLSRRLGYDTLPA